MPNVLSQIELKDFRCLVFLGWGDSERQNPQTVSFDLTVKFATLPSACLSDELQDTLCYAQTSRAIDSVCTKKSYRLIEHLGYEVFQALKMHLPATTTIHLRTTKINPPIPALKGGASFVLEG